MWVGQEGLGGLQSYRFFAEGRGPLDWGSRGLGNVESCRCNFKARKTGLGVSRNHRGLNAPHRWLENTWRVLMVIGT